MKKRKKFKPSIKEGELKPKIKYNRKKDGFKKHKVRDYKSWIQSGGAID
jgi:hypothetical protein